MDQTLTQPQTPSTSPVAPLPPRSPVPLNPILTIITFLSLLLTVFFIYQNWLTNQKLQQLIESQTMSPTPEALVPPANPTATWKTYTNTKYYFSFKYPTNLLLRSYGGSQTEPSISDSFVIDGPYENLQTLAGNPDYAITVEVSSVKPTVENTPNIQLAFEEIGNKFVIFRISSIQVPAKPISNPQVLDQILSTFQFTN